MYDFCLTMPYAALLALGGLAGFLTQGSTASLASGLGSAAVVGLASYISLQQYHSGRLCRPATLTNLVVSLALTWVMWQRFQATGKVMPAGLVAASSALMAAFLLWNLLLFKPTFKKL